MKIAQYTACILSERKNQHNPNDKRLNIVWLAPPSETTLSLAATVFRDSESPL